MKRFHEIILVTIIYYSPIVQLSYSTIHTGDHLMTCVYFDSTDRITRYPVVIEKL